MYCFSFEKGIIKLDTVVPCSCETHKQPQVSCFFFSIDLWCMASQRKNEISWQCQKQPEKLLSHVFHHHCNVLKCDLVTMNARFVPSFLLLLIAITF